VDRGGRGAATFVEDGEHPVSSIDPVVDLEALDMADVQCLAPKC
jgi:hypothetical protein